MFKICRVLFVFYLSATLATHLGKIVKLHIFLNRNVVCDDEYSTEFSELLSKIDIECLNWSRIVITKAELIDLTDGNSSDKFLPDLTVNFIKLCQSKHKCVAMQKRKEIFQNVICEDDINDKLRFNLHFACVVSSDDDDDGNDVVNDVAKDVAKDVANDVAKDVVKDDKKLEESLSSQQPELPIKISFSTIFLIAGGIFLSMCLIIFALSCVIIRRKIRKNKLIAAQKEHELLKNRFANEICQIDDFAFCNIN